MKTYKALDLRSYHRRIVTVIAKKIGLEKRIEKIEGNVQSQRVFTDEELELIQAEINKRADKRDSYRQIQRGTKRVECLKCHKKFTSEVDKMGVPYNRICPDCKRSNKNVSVMARNRILSGNKTGY